MKITDAGGIAIVLFALRAYFKCFLLYVILKHLTGLRITLFTRVILLVSGLSFILSMNASLDALYIFIAFFYAFRKGIGAKPNKKKSIRKKFITIGSVFFSGLILLGIIFLGVANKTGTEDAKDYFSDRENIAHIYKNISLRASTYYASTVIAGDQYFNNPLFSLPALSGTASNTAVRICTLLGNKCDEKPEIWSSNRLNFLLLFHDNSNNRTGASPGIFSIVYYLPFFPMSILIVAMYILIVLRLLSTVFKSAKIFLSPFLMIVIMFFLLPLFESPLNFINFLDPSAIYLVCFLIALSSLIRENSGPNHQQMSAIYHQTK